MPKVLIPKINTQVWLSYMKKRATITLQMKRKSMVQRTNTRKNLKRHISLVSWQILVAMRHVD